MELLKTHAHRVFGLKLTTSPKFVDTRGATIWDGENAKTLLGQFQDIAPALHFAENIKNNFSVSWRIFVENSELNTSQEIEVTEIEKPNYKKPQFVFDKK